MRNGTRKRGKGHDENARTDRSLEVIPKHARQHKEKHHTAARADKSADKADEHTANEGLDKLLLRALLRHRLFRRHNGLQNEFYTEKKRHENGERAHRGRRNKCGNKTADHRENENGSEHDKPVFDIQILIFSVCIRGNGRGEHVGGKRDTDRLVGVKAEERNEHRRDDSRRGKSRKTRSDPCAKPRQKINDKF